jgi:hypothetical protein
MHYSARMHYVDGSLQCGLGLANNLHFAQFCSN